jgi:alpha-amylase
MPAISIRPCLLGLVTGLAFMSDAAIADVPGVAAGIPEAERRNVIVQLFNWKFNDITDAIPNLKSLGYSHIHVSPPQESNEFVWQWWGRYQPVDHSTIAGPLGTEAEFEEMNEVADAHDIQIVVDTVFNHTVDVTEQPDPPFLELSGNVVSGEKFPQFEPEHFHPRCPTEQNEQTCWLSNNLADLKTTDPTVRSRAKEYLQKLQALGVDGFRFDAAIHVEPEFYSDVLAAVPDTYAFGEIIKDRPSHFSAWIAVSEMDYYDFPLTKTMREAFAFGGDLRRLKEPEAHDEALGGPKAITFVRNHDIDRGQNDDRGLVSDREKFGIGWTESSGGGVLDRTDVELAYAFIFGREDGLPYVFVDMNTIDTQDDRFDDPAIVSGIRFHNLCLAGHGGVDRRSEIWRIETPNAIAFQRGDDRLVVINKAGEVFPIRHLETSLEPGTYKEVRRGWLMQVQPDGKVIHWDVPGRSAMMFVRVGG